jgi:hypothetical protein
MTRDDDDRLVLDDDDERGINALIATLDIHVRGQRSYTVQEATKFVREWEYIHRPHAREYDDDIDDDEC